MNKDLHAKIKQLKDDISLNKENIQHRLALASALLGEIETQCGIDIACFSISYQARLLRQFHDDAREGVLFEVANKLSDGCEEMIELVNDLMIDNVYEKVHVAFSKDLISRISETEFRKTN